jgi:hypothetical protein
LSLRLMSFQLIYYEVITSSNTLSNTESSLATHLRTGMAKSQRSIGGCRVKVLREDQQVLKLLIV